MKGQAILVILTGFLYVSFSVPTHIDLEECEQNFVEIYGKTNVNTFELELEMDKPVNLLNNTQYTNGDNEKFHKINFPVKSFESRNKAMYRDFISIMKADQYPYITITLPKEQINGIDQKENSELELNMNITIAGITKNYMVPARINLCQDKLGKQQILHGTKELALKDFNIDPPTRLMGMVQVENNVVINFGFSL